MASAPRRLRKSTLALQGRLRVAEEELLQQRAFVAGLEGELAAAEARAAAAEARLLEVRRLTQMFIHTVMHVCINMYIFVMPRLPEVERRRP